jgi:uncharacterized protein
MAKDFDPLRLDLRRFAEEAGELASDAPLRTFGRLLGETEGEGAQRPLHWRARGELRNAGHVQPQVWMHLEAQASLPLVCQRCLRPVDVDVAFERSFRFVTDEATAAAEDDAAEEDVLALSRSFDLLELVEDEMLMELPVAPRHETCPEPVVMSAVDPAFGAGGAERENPFAVLGKLKTGKS